MIIGSRWQQNNILKKGLSPRNIANMFTGFRIVSDNAGTEHPITTAEYNSLGVLLTV